MSVLKNYQVCCDEINKYFRQKYLGISNIVEYNETYNYIIIRYINFHGYCDHDKMKNKTLEIIINYFLEHVEMTFKKYNISKERIIHQVNGIYFIMGTKTLIDYIVITDNNILNMNNAEASDYLDSLPKLP